MQAVGFVIPILPGKTDEDREAMTSCWHGQRKAAHEASRRHFGIGREGVWIQGTPSGDVAVVYMEADDISAAFKGLGTSEEPFDRWFREYVRNVHGVALEEGMPPPEQVLDYRGSA
jgi:hypothetical protein